MTFDSISPILMILVRYAISGVGVWLVGHGFSEADAGVMTEQTTQIITGAILAAAPAIYAALKRPSAKAMETAKQVDKQIPKGEDVTLLTPPDRPNVVVLAKAPK